MWAAVAVAAAGNTSTSKGVMLWTGLTPGDILAAIVSCAAGGAILAIPIFGYGPLMAVILGLVLGTVLMEQLRDSAG